MSKRITSEQEDELIRRYNAGEAIKDICTTLSLSKRSVYNIINKKEAGKRRVLVTLDDTQSLLVAQRYLAGESADTLADEFGVHKQTVYNILARRGVSPRVENVRLNAEERREVASACASGSKVKEAAVAFNVGETTVNKILREAGVDLPKGRPPVYTVNHAAFDVITPESAYWIGFLFADGCIYKNVLICSLGIKDREHLEKMRTFLKSNHPIYETEGKTAWGGPFARLSITSAPLFNALRRHGIIAKKLRVPTPELAQSRDFWRGMVDGDGTIGTIGDGKYIYPQVRLFGQTPLLEKFQHFTFAITNSWLNTKDCSRKDGSVFTLSSGSRNAGKIIDVLYRNASVSLDRKNKRAQAIIAGDLRRFEPYEEPEIVHDPTLEQFGQ